MVSFGPKMRPRLVRLLAAVLVLQVLLFGVLAMLRTPQVYAAPNFSFALLTWNLIGLDSNKPDPPDNEGPNEFPVGWRICNTSGSPMTNVTANINLLAGGSAYIGVNGPTSLSFGSLAVGACKDAYFVVIIQRNTSAWFTSKDYYISASATSVASESSPTRTLYVEKLISQHRNGTYTPYFWSGPTNVTVGQIYTFTVKASTATGGYESWESFTTFSPTGFQIISTTVTYPQPSTTTIQQLWVDGCTWIEATRTCTNNNKGGGDPDWITYTVRIKAAGVFTVSNYVYDFSGSSYHYASDWGTITATITSTTPTAVNLISFKARPTKKGVRVKWETGTELNTVGFNVWRKTGTGEWKQLNTVAINATNMGTVSGAKYAYVDKTAKPGKMYRYKLEVLTPGKSEWSEVIKAK